MTENFDYKRDAGLADHMRGLYRGIGVPSRFAQAFRNETPWNAASEAVASMLSGMRKQDTKKADMIGMMREVEDSYKALYVPSKPAYHTNLKASGLAGLFARAG